jgi:hypothetical protein
MAKPIPILLTILIVSLAGKVCAQALPANDVWLLSIVYGIPEKPVKISTGNVYNNQPHFSADGTRVYYTRELIDGDNSQTDIAVYNTRTSTTSMVSQTNEDEYSPTPIPGRNAISVIQVEADGKQRLWAIDIDNGEMKLLLAHVEPVGYHAWINDTEVAMFILGESFTLQTASLDDDVVKLVADNIGRSIRKHPQTGEMLFVDKNREPWQIAAYDPESGYLRAVMPLFPASEDFTVDLNGDYWTGNGSKLYRRSPGDRRWELAADFSTQGLKNISRLAIHLGSQKIALVSDSSQL